VLARMVAEKQPMKLASLEGQFKTESGAPLRIGGLPFPDERVTKYAIELPHGLSLLAFHRPNALIKGLDQEPRSDWPNVRAVHICFQIMVGCGSLLSLFALGAAWLAWRRGPLTVPTGFLKALILVSPLGFVALEAGWMVTELGRQPWIIYHLLRTSDTVTSMPDVSITFGVMTALYVVLGIIVVWLLSRHVITAPDTKQVERAEALV
jgi:cytochrome d ubiquinol oxidase subunit I